MPSKSKAQANLMRAVAHNPGFAARVGIPMNVAKEFVRRDKRKTKKERANLPERVRSRSKYIAAGSA